MSDRNSLHQKNLRRIARERRHLMATVRQHDDWVECDYCDCQYFGYKSQSESACVRCVGEAIGALRWS